MVARNYSSHALRLWMIILVWIMWPASLAFAQVKVNVEYSTVSNKDPHPTTYTWDGEVEPLTEPGPEFYTFYYTGTVNPDARVDDDAEIQRIPVLNSDWVQQKKFLIARLTLFYQLVKGVEPTALKDIQALQPQAPGQEGLGSGVGNAPAQVPGGMTGFSSMGTPTPTPSPTPRVNKLSGPGGFPEGFGKGKYGRDGGGEFDPKAAAEWTFFYDQLVLWQYYCARDLLLDTELIDKQETATGQEKPLTEGQQMLESYSKGTEGGVKQETPAQIIANRPGGGRQPIIMSTGGGGTNAYGQEQATVREIFTPELDYTNPDRINQYREVFIGARDKLEQDVYDAFIGMINRINERKEDRDKREEWYATKQKEILKFVENWRQLQAGDTLIIEDRLFLVTDEPMESVPIDAVNVVKSKQLTPQDFLNEDGTLRQPEFE